MTRTIGIVDAQAPVSATLAAAFARAGYCTRAAHTFRDAIAMMATAEPEALVVSVELGAYNGLHVLLRCGVEHPATRVVVMGPASARIEQEALALGAAAYLPRPLHLEDIVDTVEAVLDNDAPSAGDAAHVRHA
jgi:ActR/RegA family two-component response regulator